MLKFINKFSRLTTSKNRKYLVVISIAVVGAIVVLASNAATPSANIEPENGTLAGKVCGSNNATASNGSSVTFGTACTQDLPGLSRIPWEGGPNYWKVSNGAQFAKADAAGWDDPSFFPIQVFLSKADTTHVAKLKAAGINTYQQVEHDPGIFPLSNITNAGLFAIVGSSEWTSAEINNDPKAVGWFASDECEMGYSGCLDENSPEQRLAVQQSFVNQIRNKNDGRFAMANFGNGVLRTFWGSDSIMKGHVQIMDVTSADKYSYTSPGVRFEFGRSSDWSDVGGTEANAKSSASYGWQADQMKRFQDPNKLRPIWTFLETAMPYLGESGAEEITPERLSGAVWSALIHEARGIAYFQQNGYSSTKCTANYSIVDCPAVAAAVKNVNDKVKSLAPVLNTQSYYNTTEVRDGFTFYRYRFNNGTDTMLKTYSGSAYIFAGLGMKCNNNPCTSGAPDTPGNKTFTLPTGVNGTSVEVVGENRTIPVTNRQFSDSFPQEYSNHVYKITL